MEKNKELTPMMEMIEKITKEIKSTKSCDYKLGLNTALEIAKGLLPKEKQVIKDAYANGAIDFQMQKIEFTNGDDVDYYNTKYNNQIK